jgi:glutathione-regulated potassium-efflux system protein KefB
MATEQLLFAAAVMMSATALIVSVARQLKVGLIAALLIAGVLLGPHSSHPLVTHHVSDLQALGEVGVMLLLFLVGLDTHPQRLWSMRWLVAGFGSGTFLLCSAAIFSFLLAVAPISWQSAVVIGLGLAMSSTAVPLATLHARRELESPHGRLTVAAEVLQSVMIVPVLALIPLMGHASRAAGHTPDASAVLEVLATLAGVFLLGRVILPYWLRLVVRQKDRVAFALVVLAGVFAAAWGTNRIGESMALGAFLTGQLLSTSPLITRVRHAVNPARHVLLGMYFIAMGMAIDLHAAAQLHVQLLLYVAGVLLIKLAMVFLCARAFRADARTGFLGALLLMPLDEVAYAIFASANAHGLLDAQGYALALLSVSVSFLVTPILINIGFKLTGAVMVPAFLAAKSQDPSDAPSRRRGPGLAPR